MSLPTDPAARRTGGTQFVPRPASWRLGDPPPWIDGPTLNATQVLDAVALAAKDRDPTPPTFPDARPSAVLIALVDGAHGAEVLLTKRSKDLRNHAGEISFPGGRIEAGETPVQAAVREAHEEVALDPSLVRVGGGLGPMSTVVSRSYILPVVAELSERPSLVAQEREVARIMWVPLAELVQPSTVRQEWWGTPPLDRRMSFFELDDETVWGATAHMLYELLTVAYGPPATRTAL